MFNIKNKSKKIVNSVINIKNKKKTDKNNKNNKNNKYISENIQNSYVYIDFLFNGQQKSKRIIFEMFNNESTDIVNNFITLCKMGLYVDIPIHRVIKGFLIQTGDFSELNGKGGKAVNNIIVNEKNNNKIKHDKEGLLSMIIDDNHIKSQFIITLDNMEWLESNSIVIGKIFEGKEILEDLKNISVENSNLSKIISTGVFENINELNKYKEFIKLFENYEDLKKNITSKNINNILYKNKEIYDQKEYKTSIQSLNWYKLPILKYNETFFIYENKYDYINKKTINSNIPEKFSNSMIIEIKDFITFENSFINL